MDQQIEPQNNITESKSSSAIAVAVSILITALFTAGIVYFWQNQVSQSLLKKMQNNIAELQKKLSDSQTTNKNLQTQISSLQEQMDTTQNQKNIAPDLMTEEEIITTDAKTFSDIEACDAPYNYLQRKISTETISALGLDSYIEEGYKIEDICFDNNLVGFILAKMINEKPNDNNRICGEYNFICDKDVFGLIDTTNNKQIINEYTDHLGIYTESYSAYCRIDKIIADKKDLSDSSVLFYCGTGENMGFSWWNKFDYAPNTVTSVMSLTSLGDDYNDKYDIKSESLLNLFRNKSRKDIYQK